MPSPDTAAALDAAEQAFADAHANLERVRLAAADERRSQTKTAQLARLDGGRASAAEIVTILQRDGTVVLEGMMRPEQADSLQQELAMLEPFAHRAEPGSFSGENTVSNGPYLVAACPTAQELALHPKLTEVVEVMLSPYARRVAIAVVSGATRRVFCSPPLTCHCERCERRPPRLRSAARVPPKCCTGTTKSGRWICSRTRSRGRRWS